MNAEIWAAVGTTVATLVLFIVPGLVYTWYALESMIGDKDSYASVIAQSGGQALSFAQVSLSPSVRLKTSRPAVDSRSGQK